MSKPSDDRTRARTISRKKKKSDAKQKRRSNKWRSMRRNVANHKRPKRYPQDSWGESSEGDDQ